MSVLLIPLFWNNFQRLFRIKEAAVFERDIEENE
jgi:hypothetical protein